MRKVEAAALNGAIIFGRNDVGPCDISTTVVDVITVTTAVAYGRKLLGQCYKTFIRS